MFAPPKPQTLNEKEESEKAERERVSIKSIKMF